RLKTLGLMTVLARAGLKPLAAPTPAKEPGSWGLWPCTPKVWNGEVLPAPVGGSELFTSAGATSVAPRGLDGAAGGGRPLAGLTPRAQTVRLSSAASRRCTRRGPGREGRGRRRGGDKASMAVSWKPGGLPRGADRLVARRASLLSPERLRSPSWPG